MDFRVAGTNSIDVVCLPAAPLPAITGLSAMLYVFSFFEPFFNVFIREKRLFCFSKITLTLTILEHFARLGQACQ
jgi:hypothetical protein